MAGTVALISVRSGGRIDPTALMRKAIRLRGIYVGSRRMFIDMNWAVAAGQLQPAIDRTFAFKKAPAAYHAMAGSAHVDRMVINV